MRKIFSTLFCLSSVVALPLFGGSATATSKTDTSTYELKLSAKADADDPTRITVTAEMREGTQLLSAPTIVFTLGEPASVETKMGNGHFVLEVLSDKNGRDIQAHASLSKNGELVFAPNLTLPVGPDPSDASAN